MKTLVESQLRDGRIFGDVENNEYLYVPSSEIGVSEPKCIFERNGERIDVDLVEALSIVTRYSLDLVTHPSLGKSSV